MLSAARERYKNTFSKVSFNISCNKNRLATENIFSARGMNCKKPKTTIKKVRVGDLNLGTVGNRKHTYFLFGLIEKPENTALELFAILKWCNVKLVIGCSS